MGWYLILATIPVGVFGLIFSDQIETGARNLWLIACTLIGLAVLLFAAEKVGTRDRGEEEITTTDAVAVGTAQALALIPGASRSGTTITAGLFRGLTREAAARFSFLLSIPAVVLSGGYEAVQVARQDARRRHHRRGRHLRVRRRSRVDPLADAVAGEPQHVHLHLLPDRARRAADRAARPPASSARPSSGVDAAARPARPDRDDRPGARRPHAGRRTSTSAAPPQAAAVAERIAAVPVAAVVTSPLERCVETATHIARAQAGAAGAQGRAARRVRVRRLDRQADQGPRQGPDVEGRAGPAVRGALPERRGAGRGVGPRGRRGARLGRRSSARTRCGSRAATAT